MESLIFLHRVLLRRWHAEPTLILVFRRRFIQMGRRSHITMIIGGDHRITVGLDAQTICRRDLVDDSWPPTFYIAAINTSYVLQYLLWGCDHACRFHFLAHGKLEFLRSSWSLASASSACFLMLYFFFYRPARSAQPIVKLVQMSSEGWSLLRFPKPIITFV